MNNQISPITLENVRILFRNFAGKEGPYNREGDRNFCVLLEPELAEQLSVDGWNVKALRSKDDEDDNPDQPYIQVAVGYKSRPPTVVMIGSRGRTALGQHEIEILDWVDVKYLDMIVRPYTWTVGTKTGIKAYLKSIYVTLDEDDLAIKYADIPVVEPASYVKPPWGNDG